jgi:RNA polymerase sigma-70 factor, ECF subfamily
MYAGVGQIPYRFRQKSLSSKIWRLRTSNNMVINDRAQRDFAAIYSSESDAVFRFCLLRTSDRELALDFTQDTFMRFWNTLNTDKVINNHRTFLFTIARNLIIDWYRKKKSTSLDAILEGVGVDKSSLTAVARENVEIEAEAEYLIRKIALLEEPYQNAVYLRCVEELKPREIADIIGESANVVSVRISRGLGQLRTLLHLENERV